MTLTADQFSQALLGRGYFPKELPPPFQTQKLADKLLNVRATWTTLRGAMTSSARKKHPESTHSVLFDMARKGHARRTLAVPNVINQFYLVEELAKYWDQITSVIDQSSLSITKCSVTSEGRAVYVPPLSILAEKRVILQAAQGAILHTDVLSSITRSIHMLFLGRSTARL